MVRHPPRMNPATLRIEDAVITPKNYNKVLLHYLKHTSNFIKFDYVHVSLLS